MARFHFKLALLLALVLGANAAPAVRSADAVVPQDQFVETLYDPSTKYCQEKGSQYPLFCQQNVVKVARENQKYTWNYCEQAGVKGPNAMNKCTWGSAWAQSNTYFLCHANDLITSQHWGAYNNPLPRKQRCNAALWGWMHNKPVDWYWNTENTIQFGSSYTSLHVVRPLLKKFHNIVNICIHMSQEYADHHSHNPLAQMFDYSEIQVFENMIICQKQLIYLFNYALWEGYDDTSQPSKAEQGIMQGIPKTIMDGIFKLLGALGGQA